MLEILYTTLVLFGFLLPFFFIFSEFKPMKLGLIIFQHILSIILLSDNFYKDHYLFERPDFQFIQNLDFYPINNLYGTYLQNGTLYEIKFNRMNNLEFSLIKTEKYSTECLESFYIKKGESCPITDIIIGDKNDRLYNEYIPLDNNKNIYYTKENKLGKLYDNIYLNDLKENNLDYFSIEKIIRKEKNKLSNPVYNFKVYIKFCDIFCYLLIIYSFWVTLFESLKKKEC